MKNVFQGGEKYLITSNGMAQDEKAVRDVLLSLWDFFPVLSPPMEKEQRTLSGCKPGTE